MYAKYKETTNLIKSKGKGPRFHNLLSQFLQPLSQALPPCIQAPVSLCTQNKHDQWRSGNVSSSGVQARYNYIYMIIPYIILVSDL